jgi:hypothetical protein
MQPTRGGSRGLLGDRRLGRRGRPRRLFGSAAGGRYFAAGVNDLSTRTSSMSGPRATFFTIPTPAAHQ